MDELSLNMKKPDRLFELIHSLNKTEKRYFKTITSRQQQDTNYVRLFEAIEKLDVFDKKKIIAQFSGENFLKRFNVAKDYLYYLILKSLRGYYAESSLDTQLYNMLDYAEILFSKKALSEQALKLLSTAEKYATESEKFEHLLLIKNTEDKITRRKGILSEKPHKEKQEIVSKIRNYNDYRDLLFKMRAIVNYPLARNAESIKKIGLLLLHPLLKDKRKVLSERAQWVYHYIHSSCYLYIGKINESYLHSKKIVELSAKKTSEKREGILSYVVDLTNLIAVCLELKKFDEAKMLLSSLRAIRSDQSHFVDVFIFSNSHALEALLYMKTKRPEKVLALIPSIMNGIDLYRKSINQQHVLRFYYLFAQAYFAKGFYKQAAKWIHQLLNTAEDSHLYRTQHLYCFAKIFNVIIHYELGDNEFLRYNIISAYRFLHKKQRLYKLEDMLLKHVREILVTNNITAKQKRIFTNLHKDMVIISKDPYENKIMEEYFQFKDWIAQKIKQL